MDAVINAVKNSFTIKNLETISGIKSHTIRIWEKRYKLLEPKRTSTNIRRYDLDNFKKLLNIALLIKNGYKISKIANLSLNEIKSSIREISIKENSETIYINSFKLLSNSTEELSTFIPISCSYICNMTVKHFGVYFFIFHA
mgnify:CR=1 FL=1